MDGGDGGRTAVAHGAGRRELRVHELRVDDGERDVVIAGNVPARTTRIVPAVVLALALACPRRFFQEQVRELKQHATRKGSPGDRCDLEHALQLGGDAQHVERHHPLRRVE
jgi:hypothetical protein